MPSLPYVDPYSGDHVSRTVNNTAALAQNIFIELNAWSTSTEKDVNATSVFATNFAAMFIAMEKTITYMSPFFPDKTPDRDAILQRCASFATNLIYAEMTAIPQNAQEWYVLLVYKCSQAARRYLQLIRSLMSDSSLIEDPPEFSPEFMARVAIAQALEHTS